MILQYCDALCVRQSAVTLHPCLFHSRCTRDAQTEVELNGASQRAHFSFEAFRFVEHKNQPISAFYLHCITRLCEVSSCSSLKPVGFYHPDFAHAHFYQVVWIWALMFCFDAMQTCQSSQKRRKREAENVSANTTVTSHLIIVGKQSSGECSSLDDKKRGHFPRQDSIIQKSANLSLI